MQRLLLELLAGMAVLSLAPLRAQNIHITSTQGDVAVARGDGAEKISRSLSATLVTGDRIVTGGKAQAEVQLDPANALQVGPASQVSVGEAYPGRCQLLLEQGGVTWRVGDPAAARMELQSPSIGMRPQQPGIYTVGINAKGETEITARSGVLEVFAPTGSQLLEPGQKMLARGLPADPEFQIVGASRWRRLFSFLSGLQMGGIVSSFTSAESGGSSKPRTWAQNPAHSGKGPVSPPETHHPPATGSQHGPAPQHAASPAAAPASASHAAPAAAPASSAAASHGK